MKRKNNSPKILYIDIETSLMQAYVFGLGDQYIGPNDIKEDTKRRILSFAAKWSDSSKIIQYDLKTGVNDKNERILLKKIFKLLDEAHIVIGQNSDKFDLKIINDGFINYGLGKPSPYRTRDTLKISRKYFSPISHKLEYRSENLNKKYKKQKHSKFPGKVLWIECQNGNQAAWKEMAIYNIFDVLATEEYYQILQPWDTGINFNVYSDNLKNSCNCGKSSFQKRGFNFTNKGKFQRYLCTACGAWSSSTVNLLSKEKRTALQRGD